MAPPSDDSGSSDTGGAGPGLPEYAVLLAARHAAHEQELRGLVAEHWGGQSLSVLDVACGDGFYARLFDAVLGPGGRVTAVDVSEAFLTWARSVGADRARERIAFVKADAERLPFAAEGFDVAWCAQSLISLPDPPAVLREMRRVVRCGGTVGILENDRLHEMQMPWPADLELVIRHAEMRAEDAEDAGDKPYVGRHLEGLLKESGLMPNRRITLSIDRRFPLSPADESFVQTYLHSLIQRTAGLLEAHVWEDLRRLSEPGSPAYLPAQPEFWMTWTDVVVLASRD